MADRNSKRRVRMLKARKSKRTTTVCSNMHCYNKAKITNDPSKPPFCTKCKKGNKHRKSPNLEEELNT